MSHQRLPLKHL